MDRRMPGFPIETVQQERASSRRSKLLDIINFVIMGLVDYEIGN